MTLTEAIRRRLRAGQEPASIAVDLGIARGAVHRIRWRLRHPDYHRTYMQRWRDCHPASEQRQALQKQIRAIRERRAGEAQRVQTALAHWYG